MAAACAAARFAARAGEVTCDPTTRGKAWAFDQAMGAGWYYAETNPAMSRMGRRTLDRIKAGEPIP